MSDDLIASSRRRADCWTAAAAYAQEQLLDALRLMVALMNDDSQASTSRATIIKTFVDVAVKLHDLGDTEQEQVELLDRLISIWAPEPEPDQDEDEDD